MYFTLKDDKARIMAVMFAGSARSMKFIPENGMNVLVKGSVTVYESSGQYQMYVQEMQPDGIGELFLAYEQLKERLEKEGLFQPDQKEANSNVSSNNWYHYIANWCSNPGYHYNDQ